MRKSMESVYFISLTLICVYLQYEFGVVDCLKPDHELGNANLYTADSKKIQYSATSNRWINIPDLLITMQSKKIKEFCYSGTWLMYKRPHFLTSNIDDSVILSGENVCTRTSKHFRKVGSIQPIGDLRKKNTESLALFAEKYYGKLASIYSGKQRSHFKRTQRVRSLIIVGHSSWTLVTRSGRRFCLVPTPKFHSGKSICTVPRLVDIFLAEMFVGLQKDECFKGDDVFEISDCRTYDDIRNEEVEEEQIARYGRSSDSDQADSDQTSQHPTDSDIPSAETIARANVIGDARPHTSNQREESSPKPSNNHNQSSIDSNSIIKPDDANTQQHNKGSTDTESSNTENPDNSIGNGNNVGNSATTTQDPTGTESDAGPENRGKESAGLNCKDSNMPEIAKYLRLRNHHDFAYVEQLEWATKYRNVRRTELLDLTFDIVIATCPIVPVAYFQIIRELLLQKLDTLWENDKFLVNPEYEFETNHRALLFQVQNCYKVITRHVLKEQVENRIVMPLADLEKPNFLESGLHYLLKRDLSFDRLIDTAWAAANHAVSLCHATAQYGTNLFASYVQTLHDAYFNPLYIEQKWNNTQPRNVYDVSLGGYDIEAQYTRVAWCASVTIGLTENLDPFRRFNIVNITSID